MVTPKIDRRLTAILMADIVAYSRLMQHDESGTVACLRTYQKDYLAPLLVEHHGRIVNEVGDAVLCEFASVVGAVECAAELQARMREQPLSISSGEPIQLRIGVNLGEVLVERDGLFGDGINIAARLQSLAQPGSICVSGKVRDEVAGKLVHRLVAMGQHRVKNIAEPIAIFRVEIVPNAARPLPLLLELRSGARLRWWPLAGLGAVALAAGIGMLVWEQTRDTRQHAGDRGGDRPSIAVLPFDDLSASRDQQYFADGIAEELITGLAKFPDLVVIARNSSFTYKDRPIDIRKIGSELGVRYVVEGSIQRADDQVRVVTQLIDADSGGHLWAESYDRPMNAIFVIRDDVTQSVAGVLMGTGGKLEKAEVSRLAAKDPVNLTAYEYLMKGWYEWRKFTREANLAARGYFEQSRQSDPNYARAYAGLAWTYASEYDFEWTDDYDETLRMALELAVTAVRLDANDYRSQWALGWTHLYNREHDAAMANYARARQLNPNDGELLAEMANLLIYVGRPQQAIEQLEEAMRLNPFHDDWYVEYLGWAYEEAGRPHEAVETLHQVIGPNPGKDQLWLLRTLAAALADPAVGRMAEAHDIAAKILAIEPNFTLSAHRRYVEETFPYRSAAQVDRWIAALRRTGLPE